MILPVHDRLRAHVARLLTTLYSLDDSAAPALVLGYPPQRELGDLGTPVAFELARRLRKAPRAIAQEIASAFGSLEGIRQVAAAPNGYLNFFLDRRDFLLGRLTGTAEASPRPSAGKAIVEHTAINPNKAAHIGHLRNAALGDTLVRLLRRAGRRVEVQNYIDNTGVQVADVVIAFQHMEKKSPAEVRALAQAPRFDYLCWDLYARITQFFEEDATRLELRGQTLAAIEAGDGVAAELAEIISVAITRCHLHTME